MDYLDLHDRFSSFPVIDLLKVDIEGSEELFIRSYPEVLKQVQFLAIELHLMYLDCDYVKQVIAASGLELIESKGIGNGLETNFYARGSHNCA